MKFESSPTPPVMVCESSTRFFTKQTATPLTGPSVNAAISAGSSEKSSEIKLGINGSWKCKNIKTVAIAASTPVIAILRIFTLEVFAVFTVINVRTFLYEYQAAQGNSLALAFSLYGKTQIRAAPPLECRISHAHSQLILCQYRNGGKNQKSTPRKLAGCRNPFDSRFFYHPDYTVGSGITPDQRKTAVAGLCQRHLPPVRNHTSPRRK
mgnify:FL=1